MLTAIVAHYAPQAFLLLSRERPELPTVDWSIAVAKWLEAVLVVGILCYFVFRQGNPAAAHGLRADRCGRQLGWGVLAWIGIYVYILATMLAFAALLMATSDAQAEIQKRVEFAKKLPLYDPWLMLVLLSAVAIHEELLFRGLLLPLLRRATGRWWAAIGLSSVLFGVLHFPQGWIAALQITGVSIVLSLFFIASRSVSSVILAHFLFDYCQMLLMRLLPELTRWSESVDPA